MVSKACDVVEQCITHGASRNQQARSGDAWRTIDAVLKLNDAPAQKPEQQHDDGPLADVSEKLRLIKQAERRAR
jgi:hypothetical protein